MLKCHEKLKKLINLERGLQGEFTESKITKFGSRFADKSTSEVKRNIRIMKREKTEIKNEID